MIRKAAIALALLAFSLASCRSGDLSWPEVKRQIREEYPHVAQLSMDDYQNDFPHGGYLVDVREKEEFDVSHIRGAVNMQNAEEIVAGFRDSGKDAVVLYCSAGYRSSKMAHDIQPMIDGPVYNLEGSIFEWANAGKPVYRGDRRVHTVHPYNAKWGKLLDQRYRADAPPIR